jgi:CRP-like cAMP-binding protein
VIFREDDTADAADLIKSGRVQILVNRNGKEQVAD